MEQQSTSGKTVRANIKSVAEMQNALEERRSLVDRIADAIGAFSGSMGFVALHLAWFTLWFVINTGLIPALPRFDPYPFTSAGDGGRRGRRAAQHVCADEADRMQRRSDLRDHLNLQIDLLAEKEVTKSLQLLMAICEHLQIPMEAADMELREIVSTTSVDMVADHVKSELPEYTLCARIIRSRNADST